MAAGAATESPGVAFAATPGGSVRALAASTPSDRSPDAAPVPPAPSVPNAGAGSAPDVVEPVDLDPIGATEPPHVNVSNSPGLEVYDPATGYVYVLDWDGDRVSVLSGTALVGTVDVGPAPFNGAYDGANGYVYVTDFDTRNVSVIDGTSLVGSVGVGALPLSATYDSADGYVYVTNGPSDNVSVLSGTTVVQSVNVGAYPFASTYDSGNGWVYVTNWDAGTVTVIGGTTVVGTVDVGVEPYSAAYDGGNGYVYVMNRYSGTVSVIDGLTVLATLTVGAAGESSGFNTTFIDSALYDGENGYVYAVDSAFGSDNVTVIDGTTVVGTVALASTPFVPGYSTATGTVYVPESGSENVSVIGGIDYLGSLNVGLDPVDALFDSQDGDIYVTNYNSNNVSVIVPENSIRIAETGLPKATSWSVTLGGARRSTTGTAIAFTVPNGSYGYSIGDVPGWHQTTIPYQGTFTVTGASVTEVTLAFERVTYPVSFTVPGLPTDTKWTATLNGTPQSSTGSGLTFEEPNGTYGYSVADPSGAPPMVDSGSVTVNGAPVSVPVTFTPVSFTETGLPIKGKRWSVTLDGYPEATPGTARTSTVTSVSFAVLNGTYPYLIVGPAGFEVATPAPPEGNLTTNGSALSEAVTFVRGPTYSLTFHEVGLAAGSKWCVAVGSPLCSTKSTVVFKNLTPGSYSYAVGAIPGATTLVKEGPAWSAEALGASLVSRSTTVQVRFAYPVTFQETGLVAPFTWSVSAEGETGTSAANSTTVVLDLTNGTQGFSVHAEPGYLRSPASGRLVVDGRPASVSVTFKPRGVSGAAAGLDPDVEARASVADIAVSRLH